MRLELIELIRCAIGELSSEACPDRGSALDGLVAYAELLAKWNERSNLVGAGTIDEIVTEHILDSVEAARVLPSSFPRTVDVGSGAGLPGLVLSILRPEHSVTLIEPRRRHASFLAEAIRRLKLGKASLFEGRVEDYIGDAPPTLWTSRAFSPMEDFFALISMVVQNQDVVAFLGGLESQIDGAGGAGFALKDSLNYSKYGDSKRIFLFIKA